MPWHHVIRNGRVKFSSILQVLQVMKSRRRVSSQRERKGIDNILIVVDIARKVRDLDNLEGSCIIAHPLLLPFGDEPLGS